MCCKFVSSALKFRISWTDYCITVPCKIKENLKPYICRCENFMSQYILFIFYYSYEWNFATIINESHQVVIILFISKSQNSTFEYWTYLIITLIFFLHGGYINIKYWEKFPMYPYKLLKIYGADIRRIRIWIRIKSDI